LSNTDAGAKAAVKASLLLITSARSDSGDTAAVTAGMSYPDANDTAAVLAW
jgi:hypothetical protein